MEVSRVWINKVCGESVHVNELRVDLDNDYHIAIDLIDRLNGGNVSAEEFSRQLISSAINIKSIIERDQSAVDLREKTKRQVCITQNALGTRC